VVFQGRIKGNRQIQFGEERLTSHVGLELLRRFLSGLEFFRELARSERRRGIGGDLGFAKVVLTVLAMLLVGAKRTRLTRRSPTPPDLLSGWGSESYRSLGEGFLPSPGTVGAVDRHGLEEL